MININLSTLSLMIIIRIWSLPLSLESEFLCPLLDMHLHSCMHYGGYILPAFAVRSYSQYYAGAELISLQLPWLWDQTVQI